MAVFRLAAVVTCFAVFVCGKRCNRKKTETSCLKKRNCEWTTEGCVETDKSRCKKTLKRFISKSVDAAYAEGEADGIFAEGGRNADMLGKAMMDLVAAQAKTRDAYALGRSDGAASCPTPGGPGPVASQGNALSACADSCESQCGGNSNACYTACACMVTACDDRGGHMSTGHCPRFQTISNQEWPFSGGSI